MPYCTVLISTLDCCYERSLSFCLWRVVRGYLVTKAIGGNATMQWWVYTDNISCEWTYICSLLGVCMGGRVDVCVWDTLFVCMITSEGSDVSSSYLVGKWPMMKGRTLLFLVLVPFLLTKVQPIKNNYEFFNESSTGQNIFGLFEHALWGHIWDCQLLATKVRVPSVMKI